MGLPGGSLIFAGVVLKILRRCLGSRQTEKDSPQPQVFESRIGWTMAGSYMAILLDLAG